MSCAMHILYNIIAWYSENKYLPGGYIAKCVPNINNKKRQTGTSRDIEQKLGTRKRAYTKLFHFVLTHKRYYHSLPNFYLPFSFRPLENQPVILKFRIKFEN